MGLFLKQGKTINAVIIINIFMSSFQKNARRNFQTWDYIKYLKN
jgi:hypothetical protein